jgi:D-Tyr-tRNA(Tyr) deacylase
MIALIQRVSQAEVRVRTEVTGAIHRGALAFIGVQREDTESDADRLLERLLTYRIFADDRRRPNGHDSCSITWWLRRVRHTRMSRPGNLAPTCKSAW